jgi:hypothetical protein
MNYGNDDIFLLVQIGSIDRLVRLQFRALSKRARDSPVVKLRHGGRGDAAVGRIVNGMKIGERIKQDGRTQMGRSCSNVQVPAHSTCCQVLPGSGPVGSINSRLLIAIGTTIY